VTKEKRGKKGKIERRADSNLTPQAFKQKVARPTN
jgi:hypothetical protein